MQNEVIKLWEDVASSLSLVGTIFPSQLSLLPSKSCNETKLDTWLSHTDALDPKQ